MACHSHKFDFSSIVANVNVYYTEDLKRLNDKLVETNTVKMELQLKLDELQSSEVSIQVRSDSFLRFDVHLV